MISSALMINVLIVQSIWNAENLTTAWMIKIVQDTLTFVNTSCSIATNDVVGTTNSGFNAIIDVVGFTVKVLYWYVILISAIPNPVNVSAMYYKGVWF